MIDVARNCGIEGGGILRNVIYDYPPKMTKYEKLTALSKTLRDDASCQLCSILLKYLVRNNGGHLADVEADLDPKGVPPLTTLRQVNFILLESGFWTRI